MDNKINFLVSVGFIKTVEIRLFYEFTINFCDKD